MKEKEMGCRFLQWAKWVSIASMIAASFVNGGCGGGHGGPPAANGTLNLTDRLLPVRSGLSNANIKRDLDVTRNGLRKKALVLVAPVAVQASLDGASGRMILEGWATPVFNVGDGMQMNLFVLRGGKRLRMGRRYFDAGRSFEDRDWIPIAFPLDLDQDDRLEIEVSAGPQGNLVADWLALSSLHLVHRNKAQ